MRESRLQVKRQRIALSSLGMRGTLVVLEAIALCACATVPFRQALGPLVNQPIAKISDQEWKTACVRSTSFTDLLSTTRLAVCENEYSQLLRWQALGVPDLTYDAMEDLESRGYTPESLASAVVSSGFNRTLPPQTLEDFAKGGVPPADAAICIDQSIGFDSYLSWHAHGFDCSATSKWQHDGVPLNEAWRLKALGVDSELYAKYRTQDVDIRELESLTHEGATPSDFEQTLRMRDLLSAGFSAPTALAYALRGWGPDDVKAARVEARRARVEQAREEAAKREEEAALASAGCPGGRVHSTGELVGSSPYATKGNCYRLSGEVVQWLDATEALVAVSDSLAPNYVLVEFPVAPTSKQINGIAMGRGVYQYVSAMGSFETVPDLEIINARTEDPANL